MSYFRPGVRNLVHDRHCSDALDILITSPFIGRKPPDGVHLATDGGRAFLLQELAHL